MDSMFFLVLYQSSSVILVLIQCNFNVLMCQYFKIIILMHYFSEILMKIHKKSLKLHYYLELK